jgi:hypothetical protein
VRPFPEQAVHLPFESGPFQKACRSGDMARAIDALVRMPHDERKRAVDDLLSVPREPMMNPCL